MILPCFNMLLVTFLLRIVGAADQVGFGNLKLNSELPSASRSRDYLFAARTLQPDNLTNNAYTRNVNSSVYRLRSCR